MIHRTLAIPLTALLLVLGLCQAGPAQSVPQDTPTPPSAEQTTLAPVLSEEQLADLHMARKEFREAAAAFQKLVNQSPRNALYLNKLGIAYHQMGQVGLALKCYERAVKADPSYADARNNMGTIWYQRKKYGKAIKAYQKAIAVRPEMAVLHSNLGYAYFSEKKYEEAIQSFRRALTLDPHFFEQNSSRNASILQDRSVEDRGRFYFLLAKSFAQSGNAERCLHYLRKARDEGYSSFAAVKTDPAFAAVRGTPEAQELLEPRPAETAQP
ncbi:MAG: tetratricopeptide repeat protein [Acidobacteriia bacterium]|nr:tetratricopeptide repeat protein [Terriglobia bacterium]